MTTEELVQLASSCGISRKPALAQIAKAGDDRAPLVRKWRRRRAALEKRICENVDKQWLDQEAVRNQARWSTEIEQALANEAADRSQLSPGARIDKALASLRSMSHTAAGSIERSRSPMSSSPPKKTDDILHVCQRRVRALVSMLEHEVDDHRRRKLGGEPENPEERGARVVQQYVGWKSWEVAFMEPRLAPRSIERIRVAAGRTPRTGVADGHE